MNKRELKEKNKDVSSRDAGVLFSNGMTSEKILVLDLLLKNFLNHFFLSAAIVGTSMPLLFWLWPNT